MIPAALPASKVVSSVLLKCSYFWEISCNFVFVFCYQNYSSCYFFPGIPSPQHVFRYTESVRQAAPQMGDAPLPWAVDADSGRAGPRAFTWIRSPELWTCLTLNKSYVCWMCMLNVFIHLEIRVPACFPTLHIHPNQGEKSDKAASYVCHVHRDTWINSGWGRVLGPGGTIRAPEGKWFATCKRGIETRPVNLSAIH